jgi:polysaccharide export outer membrane protein|tara:strand:+ start:250 stop:825 length:576 start_codon:yes stop_codon:yes gene_type:complete
MKQENSLAKMFRLVAVLLVCACGSSSAAAKDADYVIQASDILLVSVWKEEDLQIEVLVRPDGKFSFPLAGDIVAKSRTIEEVRNAVASRIEQYIPEPVVTVTLRQSLGNRIFVIGKVNRPGEFPLTQDLDVMQALALGGGLVTFADAKAISILRRQDGAQITIPFNYREVEYGENLNQNILLQPGDVVIVP